MIRYYCFIHFLDFPESIRPSLYSNNLIEGWNKHLKRRLHKIIDTPLNNKDIVNNKSKCIEKYIKLS
ncbi:transposase [Veillonella caviae]|uniref:transposase n=1 Tax=Veillonella caviae TaxID=248316 RepID=UPI003B972D26